MRRYYTLFVMLGLMVTNSSHAQVYYIAFNPFDCSNHLKGIELFTDAKNSIYFFQEEYKIDSASLRERYLFSKNAHIVFSDSLFNQYALNGRSAICNKDATLKCAPSRFDKKASDFFIKMTGEKQVDTFELNYPVAKISISKYQFTNDGKVYMLEAFDNSITLYDMLLQDTVYKIRMEEKAQRDAYEKFNSGDTSAYLYYKAGTSKFTREDLSTFKDICLSNDTLYAAVSNYYFYIGGENMNDSFFARFESINAYYDGQYIATYIPSDISDKLLDTTKIFTAEPSGLYQYGGNLYTAIYNRDFYKGPESYVIGKYIIKEDSLIRVAKLSDKYKKDYNYASPIYSDKFFVLNKSPELFNVNTQEVVDLNYFNQEFLSGKIIPDFPRYVNIDFKVTGSNYNVLYYDGRSELIWHYTRIDRKTNAVLFDKIIPPLFHRMKVVIDPYDNNSVIGFFDNNKIIRYKVFGN